MSKVKHRLRELNADNVFVVSSIDLLQNASYQERLRTVMRSRGISSRRWVDVIATTLYTFEGVLLCPEGRSWAYQEVDEVVNDRTIRNFLQQTDSPRHRRPRKIEALRYYDLTVRIGWPGCLNE